MPRNPDNRTVEELSTDIIKNVNGWAFNSNMTAGELLMLRYDLNGAKKLLGTLEKRINSNIEMIILKSSSISKVTQQFEEFKIIMAENEDDGNY